MGRKKKTTTPSEQQNKLKKALEEGKGVEGLVGYCETTLGESTKGIYDDDRYPVCIKVRCLRVETDCGVHVVATPYSGEGEFRINPCQWFDSPKAIRERREYLKRCETAEQALRDMFRPGYLTTRKANFLEYVEGMGEEEMQRLRTEIEELYNITSETKWANLCKKVPEEKVQRYAKAAVCKDYNVQEDDVDFSPRRW